MTQILETLLEITIYSAVLVAAILLFQKLFEKKLPARLRYLVWFLLVARLMIPFTWESGVHLIQIPQEIVVEQAGQQDWEPVTQYQATGGNGQRLVAQPEQTSGSGEASVQPQPKRTFDWRAGLLVAWVAGIAFSAVYVVWLRSRLRRIIRCNTVEVPPDIEQLFEQCKREMKVRGKIGISVQTDLDSPALTMSVRPVLLLPRQMMRTAGSKQIAFAIRHELSHFARKDHIVSLLMTALRSVYWFNPLVWLAFRRMHADMEMACDEQVTEQLCKEEKKKYVEAIINLSGGTAVRYTLGMGLSKGRAALEKRIRGIFMKKKSKTMYLSAIVLAAMLAMVCFTTACQPTFVDKAEAAETEMAAAEPTIGAQDETAAEEPQEMTTDTLQGATATPTPAPEDEMLPTEPGMYVTDLTEAQVREKTVGIMQSIYGVDVSEEKMYINDLSQPIESIYVRIGGSGDVNAHDEDYSVWLDPQTGDFLAASPPVDVQEETASEADYADDYVEPETFMTDFTEEDVKKKAAEVVKDIFGEDVLGEAMYINDLSQPVSLIEVRIGGTGGDTNDEDYYVTLDPTTGVFTSADKNFKQVANPEDVVLADLDKQERQKAMDISVELLKKQFNTDVKAYYVDAEQALFDENNSSMTDCHVLLENGDAYCVGIVTPGYTVGRIYSENGSFLSDEDIEKIDFDVKQIF